MYKVALDATGIVPTPMFDLTTRVSVFVVPAAFTLVVNILEVVREFDAYAFEMSRVERFEVPETFMLVMKMLDVVRELEA